MRWDLTIWHQKTRVPELSCDIDCLMVTYSVIVIEY